jgi:ABC-type multidrug transport system fused ATPase/permease subunit
MASPTADLLRPYRARLVGFGIDAFAMGLVEAAFLVVITRGILAIADDDTVLDLPVLGEGGIARAAAVAAILVAARFVLGFVAVRLQTSLTYRVNSALRRDLARDFLASSWAVQSRQQRGSLHHLVVQLPANATSLVFQASNAVAGGLSLTSLLVIAFVVDPLASLLVLAVLVVLGSLLFPLRRAVRARTRETLVHQNAYTTLVSEVEDLGLEINALGVSGPTADRLAASIENEMQAHRRVGLVAYAIPTVYTTLAYGAIVLAVLALDATSGDDIGSLATVMLVMLRSLTYGQQVQQGATAWSQLGPVAARIAALRDELRASPRPVGTRTIDSLESVALDHVTFAYVGAESVLNDVSVSLSRGDVIGVVGASGAGKTTLVQLILGLHSPTSGRVVVDGVAVADIDPQCWHRLVTFVPQETRLLDGTIADNVRFLRAGISDDDVRRALDAAGLSLDGERFTDGIHTDLGAAGRQFSGGQRQRLAIARALATDPSILVLDEPTSALDAASEEIVVETITRLRGRVTTIVVTHRDSTLAACDRVWSVEGGRVSATSRG